MNNERHVKQAIVIRTDLNMRKGKIAAQASHASMKVLLDRMKLVYPPTYMHDSGVTKVLKYKQGDPFDIWLKGAFTKICLQVSVEQELVDLLELAQQAKIPCAEIIDSGKTEFHNVPTRTCIAIGPWWSDEIDNITGHLELL